MANKLRVGIISANWGVAAHLPAWRANPDVEVVGICTAHQDTAEAAAKAHDIPRAFWDYRQMVADPEIDIIDAGTRPSLRYEMCLAALAAGKHVYNGIPFADTLAHARDLQAAAQRAGRVAVVDAYSEHLPPIQFAKELIDDGAVGELYSLTCTLQMSLFNAQVSTFGYNWFWNKSAGCSALRNLGSHALNALFYLFGPVAEVVAQDELFLKEWTFLDDGSSLTPQVEDTANVLVRFARGGVGVVSPAWCAIGGRGFMIDAFGSKGRLLVEGPGMPGNGTRVYRAKRGEHTLTEVPVPDRLRRDDSVTISGAADDQMPCYAMALAYADMLRAIRTGGAARPSFEQALHVHSVVEAAHVSAQERRWVRVEDQ